MNFSSLKKTLGKAYETAASTAATAAKDIQSQVVGARCLRDYSLQRQIATGGLHGLWKIYSARSKKEGFQNRVVGVWILDKRAPATFGGGRWEAVIDLCKKEAAALTRLKHPSIVKILEPMEESRTQVIMVTEAIFASTHDLLTRFSHVPGQRKQIKLSELDVKAGLLQIADGLQFLHHEANLVHRGISPGVIMLTESGAWKLAGLGLAVRAQFAGSNEAADLTFDFSNPNPPSALQLSQPPLAYVAPELLGSHSLSSAVSLVTPAADVFSLGALVYELVSGSQLFQVGNNLGDYQAKLASIHVMDLTNVPAPLQSTLKAMLSGQPSVRPNANAFTGSPYFQDDVVLRALRFLENFLQRDALQKASFLKDLEGLWSRCDARVLRYRVLPPLLAESRNEALQPVILPLIMRIVERQESQDFVDFVLPSLVPVFETASGQALFQLAKHADILYSVMNPAAVADVLLPLLCRAADLGDNRTQEEMLLKSAGLQEKADYAILKAQILPRAQRLCLATTSASVRQAAFKAMTALAPRFDKEVASEFIATTQQILRVDRSSGTVMAALALGKALTSSWGPIFAAESVLPVLSPCLAAPALSRDQFRDVYKAVEEILHSIASSRAGALEEEHTKATHEQASTMKDLPSWDTGPSTSDFTPQAQPQTIRASVPQKSQHTGMNRPKPAGMSLTHPGSKTASTDPFSGSWDNSDLISGAAPSGNSSSNYSAPLSASQLPAAGGFAELDFQPVDVTHKSWQGRQSGNLNPSQQASTQSGVTDSDPFANWPPAAGSSRLAQAGLSQPAAQKPLNPSWPTAGGDSAHADFSGLTLNGTPPSTPSSLDFAFGQPQQLPGPAMKVGRDSNAMGASGMGGNGPMKLTSSTNIGNVGQTAIGSSMGASMKAPKLAPPPSSKHQPRPAPAVSNPKDPFAKSDDPFSGSLI